MSEHGELAEKAVKALGTALVQLVLTAIVLTAIVLGLLLGEAVVWLFFRRS